MGGFGSGEYFRIKTPKKCVEDCISIDSFELAHLPDHKVRRGLYYDYEWLGRERFSLSVRQTKNGYGVWAIIVDQDTDRLNMWTKIHDMPLELRSTIFADASSYWTQGKPVPLQIANIFKPQLIERVVTMSPVGSYCSWFLCPSIKNARPCSRRCRKLYWRSGHFGCRQCHGLAYLSQQKDTSSRLFDKAERIRKIALEQLDENERHHYQDEYLIFPPPAPSMTYLRYDTLYDAWITCREEATNIMVRHLKKHAGSNSDYDETIHSHQESPVTKMLLDTFYPNRSL